VTYTIAVDRTIISLFDVEYRCQIFVTVATRASLRQISMTPLNCRALKTHRLVQDSRQYLLYQPTYGQFCVKIPECSLPWWQQTRVGL